MIQLANTLLLLVPLIQERLLWSVQNVLQLLLTITATRVLATLLEPPVEVRVLLVLEIAGGAVTINTCSSTWNPGICTQCRKNTTGLPMYKIYTANCKKCGEAFSIPQGAFCSANCCTNFAKAYWPSHTKQLTCGGTINQYYMTSTPNKCNTRRTQTRVTSTPNKCGGSFSNKWVN